MALRNRRVRTDRSGIDRRRHPPRTANDMRRPARLTRARGMSVSNPRNSPRWCNFARGGDATGKCRRHAA